MDEFQNGATKQAAWLGSLEKWIEAPDTVV